MNILNWLAKDRYTNLKMLFVLVGVYVLGVLTSPLFTFLYNRLSTR